MNAHGIAARHAELVLAVEVCARKCLLYDSVIADPRKCLQVAGKNRVRVRPALQGDLLPGIKRRGLFRRVRWHAPDLPLSLDVFEKSDPGVIRRPKRGIGVGPNQFLCSPGIEIVFIDGAKRRRLLISDKQQLLAVMRQAERIACFPGDGPRHAAAFDDHLVGIRNVCSRYGRLEVCHRRRCGLVLGLVIVIRGLVIDFGEEFRRHSRAALRRACLGVLDGAVNTSLAVEAGSVHSSRAI